MQLPKHSDANQMHQNISFIFCICRSFKRGLESCVVEENSEIILECRTTKERDVKWLFGKTVLKPSGRIVIEKESLTHRLIIHSSSPNDAGKYKCTFEDQSTWCNVKVKGNI